ncbi:hypothetical protein QF017_005805, partial [Pseudomonas laurylsulfatiphila]
PWIKRFMGDPCDEILRNHSKGSRRRFYTLWADRCRLQSLGGHHHRERHLDELFILIYCFQGTAHVVGDVSRSALLDPIRKLHDGGYESELVFVDLEE